MLTISLSNASFIYVKLEIIGLIPPSLGAGLKHFSGFYSPDGIDNKGLEIHNALAIFIWLSGEPEPRE
jgi:hypothetical protein